MSSKVNTQPGIVLPISARNEHTLKVLKALAHAPRQAILELLGNDLMNVTEIAKQMKIPVSTANVHVQILEDAGLILTEHKPARRGSQKVCAIAHNTILLQLPLQPQTEYSVTTASMPVGAFSTYPKKAAS